MTTPLCYFAYGSNLNRTDMRVRCPSAKAVATATLSDWRLTFRGVADIEPAPGRTVLGALWRLSGSDALALDRYEGAPSLYQRRAVEVETGSGPLVVMTYVMTSEEYLGLPSASYFERIALGYQDWQLPPEVIRTALHETRRRLEDRGVRRYEPDGCKRLRGGR